MTDAANGSRILGTAVQYSELHAILRSRAAELGASRETYDVPPPPPEPTVIVVEQEPPYDPSRRFKFGWQP
jgi:hypothetical protein